jgi:hypothetical protein
LRFGDGPDGRRQIATTATEAVRCQSTPFASTGSEEPWAGRMRDTCTAGLRVLGGRGCASEHVRKMEQHKKRPNDDDQAEDDLSGTLSLGRTGGRRRARLSWRWRRSQTGTGMTSSNQPRRLRVERNIYRRTSGVFEVGFRDGAGKQRWRTVPRWDHSCPCDA